MQYDGDSAYGADQVWQSAINGPGLIFSWTTAHMQETLSSSFLLVNPANLQDQLEPVAKSGNISPSHETPNLVDFYSMTGFWL